MHGLQNDPALVKWLYSEQETNYPGQFDVIDLLLRGDLDYHLWAKDPIQVAIGAQYRERHTVTDINNIGDARINPCATPGYGALPGFGGDVGDPTCQNRNGPVLYRRNFNISGTSQDYDRRYPVESAFGVSKLPVTEKLNMLASGARVAAAPFLVAAGRSGNTDRLNLHAAGLTPAKRGLIDVNAHYQSESKIQLD